MYIGFWKRVARSSCSDCTECYLVYKSSTLDVFASGVVSGEISDVIKCRLSGVSECSTKKVWSNIICSKYVILKEVISLYLVKKV